MIITIITGVLRKLKWNRKSIENMKTVYLLEDSKNGSETKIRGKCYRSIYADPKQVAI